jgi:hypothetical protein
VGLELVLSTELLVGLQILPFGAEVGYLLIVVKRLLVPAVGEKMSPTRVAQVDRDVA